MFGKGKRRHQEGTWEVRILGEDGWSRGVNQSEPGKEKGASLSQCFEESFTKVFSNVEMVSAISKRRRIISPNAFFNKDIEMLYSLCLKASVAKIKPYSHIQQLSQFSKTLLLHYHENLSLVVVLRVRNCTHGCVPGYSNVQITTRRCTTRRRSTPTTTPTECHRSTALWECVRL